MAKRRCVEKRGDGKRCERRALPGTDRCSLHPLSGRVSGRKDKKSVNVSISAEGRARLSLLAAELGVSRSELLEKLIEEAQWPVKRNPDS